MDIIKLVLILLIYVLLTNFFNSCNINNNTTIPIKKNKQDNTDSNKENKEGFVNRLNNPKKTRTVGEPCNLLDSDEKSDCVENVKCEIDDNTDELTGKCEPEECFKPTNDNPLMNAIPYDDYTKKPGCNNSVKEALLKDTNDPLSNVFSNNFLRNVYTNPVTTYLNDFEKFKNGIAKKERNCFTTDHRLDSFCEIEYRNKYVEDHAKESKINYDILMKK